MATRMRQEIDEQPEALRRTLDAFLPLAGQLRALAGDTRQVLLIARGSSDNAAVYGQYLCAVRAGRLATLASPSVATAYRATPDLGGVLAVALSQSGATEEIVETLEWARDCGARTVGVTNVDGSPLTEVADLALVTQAGEEVAVPATKTFTTQLAAMAVLGLTLAGDQAELEALGGVPDAVGAILEAAPAAEALAERLTYAETLVVSGRGYAYSTALEIALKLKEACYVSAVGLSYADLLHGPIAIVDMKHPGVARRGRRRADPARHDRPGPADRRRRSARLRHRWRPGLRRQLPVGAAGPGAPRASGADGPHRPRAAPGRGAGPGQGHRPRRPKGAA